MSWYWYCKKCNMKHNTDVCPRCNGLNERTFEKICPETGDECEYEPADDEPCHQCRIFRGIKKCKCGKEAKHDTKFGWYCNDCFYSELYTGE